MRSNYKALGQYICEVNNRNSSMDVDVLLGVSIQKKFIPSIANIIGTDMSTYKVVKKNQFAYGPVTSRNGDKISIALLEEHEQAIVSQAYVPFEIIDSNKLLPEYLMMWFSRPEFDRYTRFMSHGSAREIFSWEDMCNVQLPIPDLEIQKAVVKEYNVLVDRINLNNTLIQKLEETSQTIYKQWFDDFEFPDETGKPYKSSGGDMYFDEKINKEIPKEWKLKKIGDLSSFNESNHSSKDNLNTIEYLDTSNITNNEIFETQELIVSKDVIPSRAKKKVFHNNIIFSTIRPSLRHFGIIKYPKNNMIVSTGFAVIKPTYPNLCSELLYLTITSDDNLQKLQSIAEMSVSTYPSIKPEDIMDIYFILSPSKVLERSNHTFVALFDSFVKLQQENKILQKTCDVLLSRISTIN